MAHDGLSLATSLKILRPRVGRTVQRELDESGIIIIRYIIILKPTVEHSLACMCQYCLVQYPRRARAFSKFLKRLVIGMLGQGFARCL